MIAHSAIRALRWAGLLSLALCQTTLAATLPSVITFKAGPVNQVLISSKSGTVAVYDVLSATDVPRPEMLLITHGRRDALPGNVSDFTKLTVLAPQQARAVLADPQTFWTAFAQARFHDYGQQSTKILASPIPVTRWVQGGDTVTRGDLILEVMDTPGYTRDAVTYLTTVEKVKLAFTGDLIYGSGQILDLYSFQDAIPDANIQGYHGYGGRLGALVDSLQKLKKAAPDILIPSRGPIITNPEEAITRLMGKVRALYRNYLSTIALHWYFKEDRMRLAGEKVLGSGADIELMPYATHRETPDWIFKHSTSRLLISDDGHGFLLDCGYQRVIDAVQDLMKKKLVRKVEGIFVTHFHDDHTDMVQAAAEVFNCPVYAVREYADILARPEAYHMPAMTTTPIRDIQVKEDGDTLRWRGFDLTFHFYPGQTFYHGALLARKSGEEPIFFIGDSFAPSGMDDYCVLNRNLLHADTGYRLCLDKLRKIKQPFWLINEHIPYVFRFSERELDYMQGQYLKRIAILKDLFPWDDPNYGIDEQWAVFYPYGSRLKPGQSTELQIRVLNHSPVQRLFRVRPRGHGGVGVDTKEHTIRLDARKAGVIRLPITAPQQAGVHLVTADITSGDMDFRQWIEAMIEVSPSQP